MTDLEKIQTLGTYIKNADMLGKQYGFLIRNGRYTYQEPYKVRSKKDPKKLLNKYKSIPVPKAKGEDVNERLNDAEISFQQHVGVYTAFNNEVVKRVVESDSLFKLEIKNPLSLQYLERDKNEALWDTLEDGDCFYEIDIAKAYFQSAYKLGYIFERFYKKHVNREGYRQALRECVTWLATPMKKQYYNVKNNPDDKPFYTIGCNIDIKQKIYDNIRYNLNLTIFGALDVISWDNFIYYTIDSVAVKKADVKKVKGYFLDLGWEVVEKKCVKIDNYIYYKEGIERKFLKHT